MFFVIASSSTRCSLEPNYVPSFTKLQKGGIAIDSAIIAILVLGGVFALLHGVNLGAITASAAHGIIMAGVGYALLELVTLAICLAKKSYPLNQPKPKEKPQQQMRLSEPPPTTQPPKNKTQSVGSAQKSPTSPKDIPQHPKEPRPVSKTQPPIGSPTSPKDIPQPKEPRSVSIAQPPIENHAQQVSPFSPKDIQQQPKEPRPVSIAQPPIENHAQQVSPFSPKDIQPKQKDPRPVSLPIGPPTSPKDIPQKQKDPRLASKTQLPIGFRTSPKDIKTNSRREANHAQSDSLSYLVKEYVTLSLELEKAVAQNRNPQEIVDKRQETKNQIFNAYFKPNSQLFKEVCRKLKLAPEELSKANYEERVLAYATFAVSKKRCQNYLTEIGINHEFLEESGVLITTQNKELLMTKLVAEKLLEPKNDSLFIPFHHSEMENLKLLNEFFKEERQVVKKVQQYFKSSFKEETEWGINLATVGLGRYRIEIPKEAPMLKKIYSIYHLLKAAHDQKHSQGGKIDPPYPPLDANYIDNLEHHLQFTFDDLKEIQTIFSNAESYQQKLTVVFSSLWGDNIEVSMGRKSVTELAFQTRQFIDYDLEHDLQREPGEAIFPTALLLTTKNDAVMRMLEGYYEFFGMKSINGKPKQFLKDSGGVHKSNINWAQMEKVKHLSRQIDYVLRDCDAVTRENLFNQGMPAIVDFYKGQLGTELNTFIETLRRENISAQLDEIIGEIQLNNFRNNLYNLQNADIFEVLKVQNDEIYEALLNGATLPGPKIWESPYAESLEEVQEALKTRHCNQPTIDEMNVRLEILANRFLETQFFTDNEGKEDFKASWVALKTSFIKNIAGTRHYDPESPVFGSQITEQALRFFERFVYNLTFIYNRLSPEQVDKLTLLFIANKEEWDSCAEGLMIRCEEIKALSQGGESGYFSNTFATLKDDFLKDYCDLRFGIKEMNPAGYDYNDPDNDDPEAIIWKGGIKRTLSPELGLGSDYEVRDVKGRLYYAYCPEARNFIKGRIEPYKNIYRLFLDFYADTLALAQKEQTSPAKFLGELGQDSTRYQKEDEWNYYFIEQDLPQIVRQYLLKEGYLQRGNRLASAEYNRYNAFKTELKHANFSVYKNHGFEMDWVP
jgi:hypothetical protein